MAEVVVSIKVEGVEPTRALGVRAAMAGADWVELRLDDWPTDEPLDELIAAVSLPVLLSCRTPDDGGSYRGTLGERRAMLERGIAAGARGVDLELWEKWSPHHDCFVVRSHHDLKRVTPDLDDLRDRLLDAGDLAKIVCFAPDLADAAPLFDLLASSDPEREPTVAFAMGERVSASRLLACALGSPWLYASAADGDETAPGQIPVALCTGLYRARELGSATRIAGVFGDPARHSLGPWIHNRALRAAGVDAVYLPFETTRPRDLLAALPRRRLLGVSVTAPHKEVLARLCHRLTGDAEATGAINTLTFDAHGVVVGHNTDVAGVRVALLRAGLAGAAPGERAVVLGGGGAARAAAVALQELGFEVMIMARTLDRIREFAERRGLIVAAPRAATLDETAPRAVVHATPVGSLAGPDGRPVPDWTPRSGSFVLDMVYRPRWTQLLRDAAAAGAHAVPGIEMFLAQAAAQVECFTGEAVEPDVLAGYLAGMGLDD